MMSNEVEITILLLYWLLCTWSSWRLSDAIICDLYSTKFLKGEGGS
uniref:Uncharacterized protein n=1 Tax=Rhizophora mucronata TaxID=61149 RepID=A0A2P2J239_RHIMU